MNLIQETYFYDEIDDLLYSLAEYVISHPTDPQLIEQFVQLYVNAATEQTDPKALGDVLQKFRAFKTKRLEPVLMEFGDSGTFIDDLQRAVL